jgi:hypothetical protein
VALNGTGVQPPAIGVSPSSLSFAAQQVGVASSPLTLTVANTGGAPMANVGFQVTGQSAASFSTGVTTCGVTLANGGSCTVQVIFTPATTGGSAATLTISSSSLGVTPVTVPLTGAGQVWSGLNVDQSQLTFAVTIVGQSSAAQTLKISNTSSSVASSLAFAVPAQFSLTQNACTGSLAAGGSCTVGLVFQPTAVGTATGVLTITSASIATPATVLLSGTGAVGAAIQVTPGAIVFATTAPNAISSPTTVTVTNSGLSASLTGLSLAVTAGFQLVNNTCPSALAPGLSCTAGVEFAPTNAGPQTGALTVTSSAVSSFGAAFGHGSRFHFNRLRLGQPDRGQRPNRRLHAVDRSAERLQWNLHIRLRHAARQRPMPLQPGDGNAQWHNRNRDGADIHRKGNR